MNFILKNNNNSEPEIPEERFIFEPNILDKNEKTGSKHYFYSKNIFLINLAQQLRRESTTFQLQVTEPQLRITNEIPKRDNFEKKINRTRTVLMESTIFDKPLKLSWPEYLCLKFQKFFSKKEKDEDLSTIEKSENIKKKVLNEDTIYKCYFEIEKLKKILFDEKELEIFKYCRLDAEQIFEKNQIVMTDKEMITHLERNKESSEIRFMDLRLKKMLLNTLKSISNA